MPVFCNKVWTVWSAYATADYPARPGRPHGQTYHHKSPLDDGEIFLYSRSWLVGQRNRCWIKALGKKPQKEWDRSWFAVPFVRGLPSVTRWTLRKWHVCQSSLFYSWEKCCVYTRQPTQVVNTACEVILSLCTGTQLYVFCIVINTYSCSCWEHTIIHINS